MALKRLGILFVCVCWARIHFSFANVYIVQQQMRENFGENLTERNHFHVKIALSNEARQFHYTSYYNNVHAIYTSPPTYIIHTMPYHLTSNSYQSLQSIHKHQHYSQHSRWVSDANHGPEYFIVIHQKFTWKMHYLGEKISLPPFSGPSFILTLTQTHWDVRFKNEYVYLYENKINNGKILGLARNYVM